MTNTIHEKVLDFMHDFEDDSVNLEYDDFRFLNFIFGAFSKVSVDEVLMKLYKRK